MLADFFKKVFGVSQVNNIQTTEATAQPAVVTAQATFTENGNVQNTKKGSCGDCCCLDDCCCLCG
jgi:hypothetical protein